MADRVEGGNVRRRLEPNGKTARYEYRRTVVYLDKEGKKKRWDKKIKLGRNLALAMLDAAKLDAEGDALAKGERYLSGVTLKEFWDEYIAYVVKKGLLSLPTITANCGAFVEFLGNNVAVGNIVRADIERFLEYRKSEHAPYTVFTTFGDVRTMFNWGIRNGWRKDNPAQGLKVPRPRRKIARIPTPEEVHRILDYLEKHSPWLHDLTTALLFTAGRVSEVTGLTWDRVDLALGTLVLNRRKVQDELPMPIGPTLSKVLYSRWMACGQPRDNSMVFTDHKGRVTDRKSAYRFFKKEARSAGMGWMCLKLMRKTAATWSAHGTGSILTATAMLGHTTSRTTETFYLGGQGDARVKAVKAVEDTFATGRVEPNVEHTPPNVESRVSGK